MEQKYLRERHFDAAGAEPRQNCKHCLMTIVYYSPVLVKDFLGMIDAFLFLRQGVPYSLVPLIRFYLFPVFVRLFLHVKRDSVAFSEISGFSCCVVCRRSLEGKGVCELAGV